MDKKRLQELNALLMANKIDREAFAKLTFDETYALFRLATIHHTQLNEQIKKGGLKNTTKENEDKALKTLLAKANYFYALSIEHIKNMEAFYVAYSQYTNAPYVVCDPVSFSDQIWAFSDEAKIDAVIEKQKEQHVLLKSEKIENSEFLKFFTTLFYMGIDRLLFDYGTEGMVFTLEHICRKPDFEKIKNPITSLDNTALNLSALYFLQEARKKTAKPDKETLDQLEEEMAKNIVSGSYIVPFIQSEKEDVPANYQLPYVKGPNNEMLLTIFTDLPNFDKYNLEHKFSAIVLSFDKIPTVIGKGNGIIINPLGFSLYMKKEQIPAFIKRFENNDDQQ